MIKINLLDKKAVRGPFADVIDRLGLSDVTPEEWLQHRSLAMKALVFFVSMYLINYVPAEINAKKIAELDAQAQKLDGEHAALTQELRSKQAVRSEMEKLNAVASEVQGKLAVITSLDTDRYRAFKVMDTVSLMIPDRVWIERLGFTTKSLDISGASWEFIPINDFVGLLKQSGVFDNVRLKAINSVASPRGIVPGVPVALQTQKRYEVSMDIRSTPTGETSTVAAP